MLPPNVVISNQRWVAADLLVRVVNRLHRLLLLAPRRHSLDVAT